MSEKCYICLGQGILARGADHINCEVCDAKGTLSLSNKSLIVPGSFVRILPGRDNDFMGIYSDPGLPVLPAVDSAAGRHYERAVQLELKRGMLVKAMAGDVALIISVIKHADASHYALLMIFNRITCLGWTRVLRRLKPLVTV